MEAAITTRSGTISIIENIQINTYVYNTTMQHNVRDIEPIHAGIQFHSSKIVLCHIVVCHIVVSQLCNATLLYVETVMLDRMSMAAMGV